MRVAVVPGGGHGYARTSSALNLAEILLFEPGLKRLGPWRRVGSMVQFSPGYLQGCAALTPRDIGAIFWEAYFTRVLRARSSGDRATAFEAVGRGFESLRARHALFY
jgi:hypothetical protein